MERLTIDMATHMRIYTIMSTPILKLLSIVCTMPANFLFIWMKFYDATAIYYFGYENGRIV